MCVTSTMAWALDQGREARTATIPSDTEFWLG